MVQKIVAILFAVVLSLGIALPAYAVTITAPDSMEIITARGFYDLVEDDDAAILFHWAVNYTGANVTADYPVVPSSSSIIFQLYAADGTTLITTATPYVYSLFDSNGYNEGVSSFYIDASDNLTPGAGYQIKIIQNPIYFTTPTNETYVMAVSDWTGTTDADMYDYVLTLCDELKAEYPTATLKTSTDSGFTFNTYGESYFRAATPGIQAMCPQLFYIQDYSPSTMTVTPYDSTLQDAYSIRMQGSEIKRGADRLATYFGVTGYFVLGLVVLAVCIGAGAWTMHKGWGLEPGMIVATIFSIGGAVLMGNMVFTIVMIIALVATMAIGFTFFGRRA